MELTTIDETKGEAKYAKWTFEIFYDKKVDGIRQIYEDENGNTKEDKCGQTDGKPKETICLSKDEKVTKITYSGWIKAKIIHLKQ